jgi:hypothetical protein
VIEQPTIVFVDHGGDRTFDRAKIREDPPPFRAG